MNKATNVSNATRISSASKKTCELGLGRRKKLKAVRKGFSEKEKETEQEESYLSGAF